MSASSMARPSLPTAGTDTPTISIPTITNPNQER
jgi:hypothetical protein